MVSTKRTVTCGELRKADVGKTVVLNGWVARCRDLGGIVFIRLRDRYGITQVMVGDGASDIRDGLAPQSARVGIAAAVEANTVLALLLGMEP